MAIKMKNKKNLMQLLSRAWNYRSFSRSDLIVAKDIERLFDTSKPLICDDLSYLIINGKRYYDNAELIIFAKTHIIGQAHDCTICYDHKDEDRVKPLVMFYVKGKPCVNRLICFKSNLND